MRSGGGDILLPVFCLTNLENKNSTVTTKDGRTCEIGQLRDRSRCFVIDAMIQHRPCWEN